MWRTVGHDRAVNALQRGLEEGRVSHAYLLAGPRQVGKMTLALDLAQALNCLGERRPCGECGQCHRISRGLHADVQVVGLESNGSGDGRSRVSISIDQVREVQRDANLKPYEGRYRIFIFDGAEHLSEEAANSLLKTLEEPPDQVVLLLLAADAAALLPTIISRCQLLELRPMSRSLLSQELQTRYNADVATADEIARLSKGRLGWAVDAVSQPELLERLKGELGSIEEVVRAGPEGRFAYANSLASSYSRDRDSGRQKLTMWLAWWRDVLLVKEGVLGFVTYLSEMDTLTSVASTLSSPQVAVAISAVQGTMDHLESNVSPRLALEHMMLALPRP